MKIDYVIPLTRIEKNDNMNDFKTKAKTGKDFAIILFDKVAEDVENTIIEISLDGMSLKTYLCEDSDTSLTIQPLSEGGCTYKITQLVNGNAYVSEGDFAIVSDIQSGSETRHIPFYEKFDKSDYYELVKFILPERVTEGEEIHLAWKLEPELFENIHLGTRKCKESMKLIRNECLTPTTSDVSFSIQEFSDAMIYLEFMLKNGQIFGIKINGEVHNNSSYVGNDPRSYSIMWSQHWEDCGETQRVEVTNVVDVQDPRSNYRSNYIPHL